MAKPFPNFYVLLWNLGGDAAVNAEQKRASVRAVLNTLYNPPIENLFVLCQNRITGKLDDTIFDMDLCKDYGFALEGHRTTGENHAAIYSSREKDFQVKCLDGNCLQALPEKDRLMVYIVECHARKILLASYHGPHILQDSEKLSIVHNLVSFLDGLRAGKNCFLAILGGTFNIDAEKVRSNPRIQKMPVEVLSCYVQPADREKAPFSDFAIRWPRQDADVQEIETTVVLRDYQRQMGERSFAHPLVLYRFGDGFAAEQQRLASINTTIDLDKFDEFQGVPDLVRQEIHKAKAKQNSADFTFTSLQTGMTQEKFHSVREQLNRDSTYRVSATAIVHPVDTQYVNMEEREVLDAPVFSKGTKPQEVMQFDQHLRSYGSQNEVFVVYGLFRNQQTGVKSTELKRAVEIPQLTS